MSQVIISIPTGITNLGQIPVPASNEGNGVYEYYLQNLATNQMTSGIYDFLISSDAQTYYETQIQNMIQAAQTIQGGAGGSQLQNAVIQFQTAFNQLYAWSQLDTLNPTTGNEQTQYSTFQVQDSNGNTETITGYLPNIGAYTTVGQTSPITFTSANYPSVTVNANPNPSGQSAGITNSNTSGLVPSGTLLSSITGSANVNNPNFVLTSTMNQYMAQNFANIANLLIGQGVDITNPQAIYNSLFNYQDANANFPGQPASLSYALQALTGGRTLGNGLVITPDSGLSIIQALNTALAAAQQAQLIGNAFTQSSSIQQVMMVDYVATANQLFYNQMNTLNQAVTTDNDALSYLNALQDMLNSKSPDEFMQNLQALSAVTTPQLADSQYSQYVQDNFQQVLNTTANFGQNISGDGTLPLQTTNSQGQITIQGLDSISQQAFQTTFNDPTSGLGPFTVNQLVANLKSLRDAVQGTSGAQANQLSTAISTIITDIQGSSDFATWIQDVTNGSPGNYQNHVNNAITAAQSLNNTQNSQLQEVMFVYQEFYSSASSMLSSINTNIINMADNMMK
jgi:hypothetical protein